MLIPSSCREFLAWGGNECAVPSWASPNWNYSKHGPEFQPGPEQIYKPINFFVAIACEDSIQILSVVPKMPKKRTEWWIKPYILTD